MVKLQKRFAYRYKAKEGDKVHYKHVITVPDEIVQKLGWSEGEDIEYEVKGGHLIAKQSKKN